MSTTQLSEKSNSASIKSDYKNPPPPIMIDKAEGISTGVASCRQEPLEVQGHSFDM